MEAGPRRGLLDSLRSLLAHGFELLHTRAALFAAELEEEKTRLLSLLVYGAAAFFLLAAGIVFLAVFLTVLFWDDHRLLTLGLFTAVFLTSGIAAAYLAFFLVRKRSRLFAASLAELAQDRAELESDK